VAVVGEVSMAIATQPRAWLQEGTQGFKHPSWGDTFAVEVVDVRKEGFNVNVARLDKLDNTGWMQVGSQSPPYTCASVSGVC
jgi:hypothetical protein